MKFLSDHRVYLISDLHLDAGRPLITRLLFDFLAGPARQARALYILGDLFEVWVGDDAATGDLDLAVANALRELSDQGVAIHFVAGNRDFLLGPDYCQKAGMTLMSEPVALPDSATLLMHGDVLCTDDIEYQRFRAKVRQTAWQQRVLSRPVWWRRNLASLARLISQWRNRRKSAAIMDVNANTVASCLRDNRVRRVIHGHTHRPAFHALSVDDRPCQRLVLGDWHEHKGSVIELREGTAWLHELVRNDAGQIELKPLYQAGPGPDYVVTRSQARNQKLRNPSAAD